PQPFLSIPDCAARRHLAGREARGDNDRASRGTSTAQRLRPAPRSTRPGRCQTTATPAMPTESPPINSPAFRYDKVGAQNRRLFRSRCLTFRSTRFSPARVHRRSARSGPPLWVLQLDEAQGTRRCAVPRRVVLRSVKAGDVTAVRKLVQAHPALLQE